MWRRWSLLLLLSFLDLALCVSTPLAHGVRGVLYEGRIIAIEASYSDGTPMAYARVKVLRGGEKIPFQKGATDKHGRFAFVPAEPGTYHLIVEDGEGHRLELSFTIEEKEGSTTPTTYQGPSLSVLFGGLLLLWLFFLALHFFLKRSGLK